MTDLVRCQLDSTSHCGEHLAVAHLSIMHITGEMSAAAEEALAASTASL